MYAVLEINGAQVMAKEGQVVTVNRMKAGESKDITFKNVLFGKKGNKHYIGAPYVTGAYAECEIVRDKRGKKLIVFKYRERKSSQSKKGHRQDLTEIRVKTIHFE